MGPFSYIFSQQSFFSSFSRKRPEKEFTGGLLGWIKKGLPGYNLDISLMKVHQGYFH